MRNNKTFAVSACIDKNIEFWSIYPRKKGRARETDVYYLICSFSAFCSAVEPKAAYMVLPGGFQSHPFDLLHFSPAAASFSGLRPWSYQLPIPGVARRVPSRSCWTTVPIILGHWAMLFVGWRDIQSNHIHGTLMAYTNIPLKSFTIERICFHDISRVTKAPGGDAVQWIGLKTMDENVTNSNTPSAMKLIGGPPLLSSLICNKVTA